MIHPIPGRGLGCTYSTKEHKSEPSSIVQEQ
jgi:hypothetical protein